MLYPWEEQALKAASLAEAILKVDEFESTLRARHPSIETALKNAQYLESLEFARAVWASRYDHEEGWFGYTRWRLRELSNLQQSLVNGDKKRSIERAEERERQRVLMGHTHEQHRVYLNNCKKGALK